MATRNSKKNPYVIFGSLLVSFLVLSVASAQQYDEAGNDITIVGSIPSGPGIVGPSSVSPPPIASCQDGNIQTLATASRSSGGSGNYGPQLGNDGLFGPGGDTPTADCSTSGSWAWISAGTYPSGAWYELEWPSPVTICQIFVDTKGMDPECGAGYNRGLHGADVQTWDGSNWVTHGSVTNANDDWGFVFPSCVTTTRLRLNNVGVVSTASQASNPILYELKVYDCSAPSSAPAPAAAIPTSSPWMLILMIVSLAGIAVSWFWRHRV